ncbi:M13 family metallopeptidase [Luteimonas composti]|uniref:M13 family metallopeptidase n=1 Tax=Luteimonas composti TaxID=398257 RepID=A0ABT6MRI8_9GAMM|nr:M13 family metallopeptidase [Luteimonas composti]MDH7453262.1 M13 family metallopeptidase [Luteimonas composti]
MPIQKPLAAALAASLVLVLASGDADAQRKRRAAKPAEPAITACSDFYSFVNKDWLAANTVIAGSGRVSALGTLQQQALLQQRALLDEAVLNPQNDVQKLLGDFWASGIDEAAVERDGAQPIASLVARIDAIRRSKDVAPSIAALHQVGIPVAFNFTADLDLGDLDRHIGYFSQGGLALPDPAFYTRDDADTRALLGRYTEYVEKILALTGTPADKLKDEMAMVLDLETRIARASRPITSLRDPRENYALVPTAGFAKQFRNLQLVEFLQAQGVVAENVSMAHQAYFTELDTLVRTLKPAQWKVYLRYQIGNAMAPYLSKDFREADFSFNGRVLRGLAAPAARDTQVLDAINRAAGPMLAREYVARYLPQATRSRAESVAGEVRDALLRSVERNSWLSETARTEARAKLQALKIEIGAPRDDLDFSVQPMGRTSFGSNMLIASTWRHREEMRRIGRGDAQRRWDVLPQQPALAYDLAHNRLVVSAAALQAPILDMSQDTAAQYGSFGALVGHELSRAVDLKGQLVDASGNLRAWWTPADEAAFAGRADQLATQYGAYAYPATEGLRVDAALTREQNVADLAAVELAFDALSAMQPPPDKAAKESFFRAWAGLWREQLAPETATRNASTLAHAPGQWRANGPLVNHPAFIETFGCKAGNAMMRKADEQVSIWR